MLKDITSKELSRDIIRYNLALLFNRAKAQQIRTQAINQIHNFAALNLQIIPQDCEVMYTYIKTFGYVRHRRVTADALSAFDRLNEIATPESKRFFRVWRGKLLNFGSIISRTFAKTAGRYDIIDYHAPQSPMTSVKAPEISPSTSVPAAELALQRNLSKQGRAMLKKSMHRIQKQLPKANPYPQVNKDPQPASTSKAPLQSQPGLFKRSRKHLTKALIGGAIIIGSALGIAALHNTFKPANKEKQDRDKIEKTTAAPAGNITVTTVNLPSPDPIHKNYYDSALKIHLGVSGRENLYDQLRNMAISQKITIPTDESIEHLAHVITVSNLVQPNSAGNRFLQECLHSNDVISGAAQNKLWHIVKAAGDRAQNIRGSSTVSNFDKQIRQIQQEHLNALQKLKQTTR